MYVCVYMHICIAKDCTRVEEVEVCGCSAGDVIEGSQQVGQRADHPLRGEYYRALGVFDHLIDHTDEWINNFCLQIQKKNNK